MLNFHQKMGGAFFCLALGGEGVLKSWHLAALSNFHMDHHLYYIPPYAQNNFFDERINPSNREGQRGELKLT